MENSLDEKLKKELAFDQYGRHAIIRDVINKNRAGGEKFKILDVGGRGNLLRKFLPDDEVFYLDPNIETDDQNYIKGDGCAMPLENESFDWVVSTDVFEHIPGEKREDFVSEKIRVARKGVILAAPFFSKETERAETNVNNCYKMYSKGEDHEWLKEHFENGLPAEDVLENFLQNKGLEYQKISNNRIFLWEIFMGIYFFYHNSKLDKELERDFEQLNYLYNTKIFPFDGGENSYRKIYFIKKEPNLLTIEPVLEKPLESKSFLDIVQEGMNLLNKVNKKHQKTIDKKEREVNEKTKRNEEVEEELAEITSSLRWKVPNYIYKIYSLRIKKFIPSFLYKAIGKMCDYISGKEKLRENRREIKKILDIKTSEVKDVDFPESAKPKVSVIIPVFNKWQFTYSCLKSLQEKIGNLESEIIIVDNASSDYTGELLDKKVKGVKYIRNNENLGFAKACNQGAKEAKGKYLLFLNNDILAINNNCFNGLVDELENNEKVAIAGCKLLYPNNTIQHAGVYFSEKKVPLHYYYKKRKNFWKSNKRRHLQAVTGACLMISKKDFFENGGFDEGYVNGLEDIDLCLKVAEKGRGIIYCPECVLYHYESITDGRFDFVKENTKRFLERWGNKIKTY